MEKDGRYAKKANNKSWGKKIVILILVLFVGVTVLLRIRNQNKMEQVLVMETQTPVHTEGLTSAATDENPEPETQTNTSPEQTLSIDSEANSSHDILVPETEGDTVPVETEPIVETKISEKPISQKTIDNYAPVLQQYRDAIMMDSREFIELHSVETELDLLLSIDALRSYVENGETASIAQILEQPTLSEYYSYVDGSTLQFYHYAKQDGNFEYSDPMTYHYAYYNIDGKRTDELLIGKYDDYHNDYTILAIYTYSSYDGPRLLQSVVDNSRWHLTIYTDGTFCLDGSGGASTHYWNYYRMHDMFDSDESVDSFTVRYDSPKSEYMVSVVEGYEAMLTPVKDILWHPLFEKS